MKQKQQHDRVATQQKQKGVANDAPLQGEGNYSAARRHRKSAEQFVESGRVEQAAHEAAPKDAAEKRDMQQAEQAGRARVRP
jgi:hypothetical protein